MQSQTLAEQKMMSTFPIEKVMLIANSEVMLCGQQLNYQTICRSKNLEETISAIVYVELVSADKTVVFKHKLRLQKGKAYGDYFLSTKLKTGHYKLIAYTEWSLNNTDNNFDQHDLYIINPYLDATENSLKSEFDEAQEYVEIFESDDFSRIVNNASSGLKITTDSKTYQPRSKVNLELQNSLNLLNYGDYTIAVRRVDSLAIQSYNKVKKNNLNTSRAMRLPEMRGELIQGTVIDVNTNLPVANQTISLSIPGEQLVYKSTSSNANGKFYLNLYEPYEQEKALIQVVAENRENFKISIDPKVFDRYDDLEFVSVKLNKNLKDFIEENSFYNQVESAYYNLKRDSVMSTQPATSFYGQPDIIYVLDDFTRFNSVKETFIEVIQNAAIRTTNGKYQFLVYDYDIPFGGIYQNVKPLLLMDGVQVQDENRVVEYNPNLMESISLVKGTYSIGSEMYNGIIDIKLKTPTDLYLTGEYIKHIDIQKPEIQKHYFHQSYESTQDRTPDLRTQLFWKPNIELKSNSQTWNFYTSDVPGSYIIVVKGFTDEGKYISISERFEVVKQSK
ncbi:MAG: Ig-like domain-containing protein [Aquaticitalea sp.]